MEKFKLWMRAVRAPFFLASLVPVLVGAALGSRVGYFRFSSFGLALLIVVSIQAGANLINDYFDAKGSDPLNLTPTPFSGGSRLIQQNLITRLTFLKAALFCFGIAFKTVVILTLVYQNWLIFALGLTGVFLGISYSATHTFGMGRGWGEVAVGAAFGPFSVLGSFLLQTNFFSWEALLAGVPVGFLIMGVLILNEFPDIVADRLAGKKNWLVRAGGIVKGILIYWATITLAYLTVLAGVLTGIFPFRILFACLTIPLAVWILLRTWQSKGNPPEIIPAMAGNIGLHFSTGILICLGLWWK